MTQKDYISIAAALKAYKVTPTQNFQDLCSAIAAVMASDNPRFDRKRFFAACGVDPRGNKPIAATPEVMMDYIIIMGPFPPLQRAYSGLTHDEPTHTSTRFSKMGHKIIGGTFGADLEACKAMVKRLAETKGLVNPQIKVIPA
jgi:hypothetical protein